MQVSDQSSFICIHFSHLITDWTMRGSCNVQFSLRSIWMQTHLGVYLRLDFTSSLWNVTHQLSSYITHTHTVCRLHDTQSGRPWVAMAIMLITITLCVWGTSCPGTCASGSFVWPQCLLIYNNKHKSLAFLLEQNGKFKTRWVVITVIAFWIW